MQDQPQQSQAEDMSDDEMAWRGSWIEEAEKERAEDQARKSDACDSSGIMADDAAESF